MNNSLAPIKSISASLESLVACEPKMPDWEEDLRRGLSVISSRTAALTRKVAATVPGMTVIEADKVCCGMGTTFGYRPDAIEPSLRMGEMSLFPQIRRAGRDTLLIADGFACRKQILDGTGRTARHSAVLLKLALAAKEKFGRDADQTLAKDGKLAKRLSRLRRDYFR